MHTAFYLARKLYGSQEKRKRISLPALRIAVAGVALGLMVMLVSVCVMKGFKRNISEKIIGFASQIEIRNSLASSSPESFPIDFSPTLLQQLHTLPQVAQVGRFSDKIGMLKTQEDFQTILLKGVAADYDLQFIRKNMQAGHLPPIGTELGRNDIVMSVLLAKQLKLTVGDKIYAYFFDQSVKTRRFTIVGLYQTDMTRFDKGLVLGNFDTVNRLNGWTENQCSGVDINLRPHVDIQDGTRGIRRIMNPKIDSQGNTYMTQTIQERYPDIFTWLSILDLNIWVILGLMIAVSSFTMISGLLILILERTTTIGILKAMGASNGLLRRVFLYFAVFLVGKGMLIGNALAMLLLGIQYTWGVIRLDPQIYYTDTIPVTFDWWAWLFVNIGTLIITTLALVGPTYLVARIQPAKAIRFE